MQTVPATAARAAAAAPEPWWQRFVPRPVGQYAAARLPLTFRSHDERPERWEWAVILVIVAVHAIWFSRFAGDYWFMIDYWSYAQRDGYGADTLFAEHGGHLVFFDNLSTQIGKDLTQFDYGPLWVFFRGAGWASVVMGFWYVMRRQGASALVAICGAVIVMTCGGVYIYRPWLMGIPIGNLAIAGSLLLMGGAKTSQRRLLLALVLTVGMAASSLTVLLIGVALVCCIVAPQLRYWLPSLLIPLFLWVLWTMGYRGEQRRRPIDWDLQTVLEVPQVMWDVVVGALQNYLGLDPTFTTLLTAFIALRFVYRLITGVATWFEILMVLLIAGFTFGTTMNRVLAGISPAAALRYELSIILLLSLMIFPTIRFERRPQLRHAVLGLLVVFIAFGQLGEQNDDLQTERVLGQNVKMRAETTAWLIEQGTPHKSQAALLPGGQGGGDLRVAHLVQYVEEGLHARPSSGDRFTTNLQVAMLWSEAPNNPGQSCQRIAAPKPIAPGLVTVKAPADREFRILWTGLAGAGAATTQHSVGPEGVIHLALAQMEGVELQLDPLRFAVEACTT